MKKLIITIEQEDLSRCMNELENNKNDIFLSVMKQLPDTNYVTGYLGKDDCISYQFYDVADTIKTKCRFRKKCKVKDCISNKFNCQLYVEFLKEQETKRGDLC